MFNTIVAEWREARGRTLRQEFEYSVRNLSLASDDVHKNCDEVFAIGYQILERRYGSLSSLSNRAKRSIASELLRKAKKSFDFNLGNGYGLFMLSAFLESDALPGSDAKFVRQSTENLLATALRVVDDFAFEVTSQEPEAEDNRVVAEIALEIRKMLVAADAREAAEMTDGWYLTDIVL